MNFEKFSPHLLRFAIEKELQLNNDTKIAAMIALTRLKKDPEYYHKKHGYIEMQKARTHKYIERIPNGKGGWTYIYMKDEFKKELKLVGKLASIMSFFGIKDKGLALQKVKFDYNKHDINGKFNISVELWTDHLAEYFKHKEKWQAFFGKKEVKGKGKPAKGTPEKKSAKEKGEKKSLIKLSIMKFIDGIYGVEVKKVPEVVPEKKRIEAKDIPIKKDDGSKIQVVKDDTPAQKEELKKDEEIAARDGYFNEKPAEILNVGKDVWGAARHNYDTYEIFNVDINAMEKDGTATAYVTKKNLFGDYGLANKDERVKNGESEYKVLVSYAIREYLNKVPPNNEDSRQKYIAFARALTRLDNDTTDAIDFSRGLAEFYINLFPKEKAREGKSLIGNPLHYFFSSMLGNKEYTYGLGRKEKDQIESLGQIVLGESTPGKISYEDIRIKMFGSLKAAGIKIKKGDNLLLAGDLKDKVSVGVTEWINKEKFGKLNAEQNEILVDSKLLPQEGEKYKTKQRLYDNKGNLKDFDDIVTINKDVKSNNEYVSYKTEGGDSGFQPLNSFLYSIFSGSDSVIEVDKNKTENFIKSKEKFNKIQEEKELYVKRLRIFPSEKGQVIKAGKDKISVSFPFPDGKIRTFNVDPKDIKAENIESVKKDAKTKTTKRINLYIESKVKRVGGKNYDNIPTSDAQQLLSNEYKFKSVQYGNSMPDTERQYHTQWSLQAFSDLSEILNFPLEQITVNGKLGIAFGARGKGGISTNVGSVAAHYEGGSKMINLTRSNGVGTMSHEWGHFLDNILSKEMDSMISRESTKKLKKVTSKEEIKHGSILERHEGRKKDRIVRYYFDKNAINPQYPFAKLNSGQAAPNEKSSYVRFYSYNLEVSEPVDIPFMNLAQDIAKKAVESLQIQTKDEIKKSPYMKNEYEKRILSNPYLNDNAEAFARAFEAYIADKLEDNGRENTYLSSKAKTTRADGALIYPQKKLRTETNKMFDDFFDMIRGSEDLKKAINNFNKRIVLKKILDKQTGAYKYRRVQ